MVGRTNIGKFSIPRQQRTTKKRTDGLRIHPAAIFSGPPRPSAGRNTENTSDRRHADSVRNRSQPPSARGGWISLPNDTPACARPGCRIERNRSTPAPDMRIGISGMATIGLSNLIAARRHQNSTSASPVISAGRSSPMSFSTVGATSARMPLRTDFTRSDTTNDDRHGVERMGRIGRAVGIAAHGRQLPWSAMMTTSVTVGLGGLDDLLHAAVQTAFARPSRWRSQTPVWPNHVAVGEVQADEVVLTARRRAADQLVERPRGRDISGWRS